MKVTITVIFILKKVLSLTKTTLLVNNYKDKSEEADSKTLFRIINIYNSSNGMYDNRTLLASHFCDLM